MEEIKLTHRLKNNDKYDLIEAKESIQTTLENDIDDLTTLDTEGLIKYVKNIVDNSSIEISKTIIDQAKKYQKVHNNDQPNTYQHYQKLYYTY